MVFFILTGGLSGTSVTCWFQCKVGARDNKLISNMLSFLQFPVRSWLLRCSCSGWSCFNGMDQLSSLLSALPLVYPARTWSRHSVAYRYGDVHHINIVGWYPLLWRFSICVQRNEHDSLPLSKWADSSIVFAVWYSFFPTLFLLHCFCLSVVSFLLSVDILSMVFSLAHSVVLDSVPTLF